MFKGYAKGYMKGCNGVRAAGLAFFLVTLLVPARFVFAEYKVATIDINRVINEIHESKDKRKSLDQMSQQAKKKVEDREKNLKSIEKKLQEERVSEDSKELQDFRAQAKDFSRFVKDTEEDLKKEFFKVNKALTTKVVQVVNKYAAANNISIVLDNSERMRGPVLFVDPELDITDSIIKEING